MTLWVCYHCGKAIFRIDHPMITINNERYHLCSLGCKWQIEEEREF